MYEESTYYNNRIHLDEFLLSHMELNVMVQAGFRSYVDKIWMRPTEWEDELQKYLNRTID